MAEDVQLVPPPPQPRDLNFLLVQRSQLSTRNPDDLQRKLDSAKLVHLCACCSVVLKSEKILFI